MRLNYFIAFLSGFLLMGSYTNAQFSKETPLYYHISEKEGLTDNLVNCFFQDSRGVMWMGTQNGLNSFDGSEIRNFLTDRKLSGIEIKGITEDLQHTLWLATSGGLASLNLENNEVHSWPNHWNNDLRSLVMDGNNLWIATSGGLLKFNTGLKTFEFFTNQTQANSTRLNNNCNALCLSLNNSLWIATFNGLWRFDTVKHTFEQFDGPDNDLDFDGLVNTVIADHSDKIWIGCWNRGLKQIIPETHTVKNFNKVNGMPFHLMSIAEQKHSGAKYSLWLSDFLTEMDEITTQLTHYKLKPISEATSLEPTSLFTSHDGLLWIATVKGVYILDPSRQFFKTDFLSSVDNITSQNPAMFARDGKIWIGGDKKFALKVFDDQNKLVKDYTAEIKNLGPGYNKDGFAVINITAGEGNDLWLSTTLGVIKLNAKTGELKIVCKTVSDAKQRTSSFISNIYIDGDSIWCFPWRRGVWAFNRVTKTFAPLVIKLPDENSRLKNLNLQDAVKDTDGNIWITDLDFGLVKYSTSKKKFERIKSHDIPPYSRAVNIMNIKGTIWLLANTSVISVNPHTNKTRAWRLPPGLDKYIYGYTNDNDGNIWIATHTGLVAFKINSHSFNHYTEEDGLLNNDMNGALYKLPAGKMVYTGENYITCFTPSDLLHPAERKKLLLTSVLADGKDLLSGSISTIKIPPGTGKIGFKWALINYTNPLQNQYYYQLERIDKGWNYAGNKGKTEYNSLPPGKYKFRYKAATADGLSGAEQVQDFKVEPFFWQTLWFSGGLAALAVAGMLLTINLVRIREQKKASLQLQLSALEMKALRAQMNPHFIFNALNSIQECIITKNTTVAYTYLSNFSKLVRLILENSEKQFITLADEIETLRLYLSIEKLRFDDSFTYEIICSPVVDPSFIRLPAMIVQPFAENALWHGLSHKKGEKKLTITFEQDEIHLHCIICDNGAGRSNSLIPQGNGQIKKLHMGMKITGDRLQLLEKGASITINDLKTPNGDALGTTVTIKIPLL